MCPSMLQRSISAKVSRIDSDVLGYIWEILGESSITIKLKMTVRREVRPPLIRTNKVVTGCFIKPMQI